MKERIKEILSDLELENVDDVVDNIAKEIALFTVPKTKYKDISDRLKSVQSEKDDVELELEELKNKNMSEDDKKAKEYAEFEKKNKALSKELNKVKAKEIFMDAKIDEDKIDELLEKVVSEDEKSTLSLTNSFVEILKEKVDETQKETETNLLENTPKPSVKTQVNEPKKYTKEDFINMSYLEKKNLLSTDKEQYTKLVSEISTGE